MAHTLRRSCFTIASLLVATSLILSACNSTSGARTLPRSVNPPALGLLVGQSKDPISESTRAGIESATGLKGAFNDKENVFKVMLPRTDIKVAVEGRMLEPFMGVTSWAAFTPGGKSPAVVAGDLVLFEDEISPVMDALLGAGLSVTALHNHFVFEKPRTFFMHIGGEGEYDALARGVKAGLEAVKTSRAANAAVGESFPGALATATSSIPQAKIDAELAL